MPTLTDLVHMAIWVGATVGVAALLGAVWGFVDWWIRLASAHMYLRHDKEE